MNHRAALRQLRSLAPPGPSTRGLKVVGWHRPIHLPGHPEPQLEPIHEGEPRLIIPLTDDRYRQPGGDDDGDEAADHDRPTVQIPRG